ncbi:MAG: hypothetical protein ABEJ76_04955 [Halanaeroarchaeum sp.]
MPPSPPFVDLDDGSLDTDQIRTEAFPVAGLIALFGALALVPFLVTTWVGHLSIVALVMTVLAQFVLAVGAAVVLMYAIARGVQLA